MYKSWRTEIGRQDKVYDNSEASVLLHKCRSNNMNLGERKRFKGDSTECIMCGNEREDLQHFILHCPAYHEERRKHPGLQRPYQDEQITATILIDNESINIENTKEMITKIWHKREKKRISAIRKFKPRPRPPLLYYKQHQGVPISRLDSRLPTELN